MTNIKYRNTSPQRVCLYNPGNGTIEVYLVLRTEIGDELHVSMPVDEFTRLRQMCRIASDAMKTGEELPAGSNNFYCKAKQPIATEGVTAAQPPNQPAFDSPQTASPYATQSILQSTLTKFKTKLVEEADRVIGEALRRTIPPGLQGWVNDYKRARMERNPKLAEQIKKNIDQAIINLGLDPFTVYGNDPTPDPSLIQQHLGIAKPQDTQPGRQRALDMLDEIKANQRALDEKPAKRRKKLKRKPHR